MASVLRFDEWQNSNGDLLVDGSSGSVQFPSRRNLLYNGAMQVAQRGTSQTSITSNGYYTADRWLFSLLSLGTWTQTLEVDGPTGSGFINSLKVESTTADASPAANSYAQIVTRLEGRDLQGLKKGTSNAEALTVSFWVKSNVTGAYIFELLDSDNTRQVSASYIISSANTWEKKTISIDGDTTGAFTNDNNTSMHVIFNLAVGSDRTSGILNTSWAASVTANRAVGQTNLAASVGNYWQITGVQLETGTVATPFEHKPYGEELALCQRYYQLRTLQGTRYISTAAYCYTDLFARMRANPSLATPSSLTNIVNTLGVGAQTATGFASQGTTQEKAGALFTGIPAGTIGVPVATTQGIAVDAEL